VRFVDEVKVFVQAGNGGDGHVGWRREAHEANGGPNGGNGGNGGVVIFYTESGLNTLIDYSFSPILKAENGQAGSTNQKEGKSGKDLLCPMPVGTQVFYKDKLVADLSKLGAKWVAAKGGIGGKGNEFFKSSTNQAPDYAQAGQAGQEFEFKLVLKSVADIGLVGFPNVGKSTLISKITKSHPKIADYPFTTLVPNLGVVSQTNLKPFVIADIPGLIPGASTGKGLGVKFLKHIERTKAILHILDLNVPLNPEITTLSTTTADEINLSDQEVIDLTFKQFDLINWELSSFSSTVAKLPRLIAFSKSDTKINQRAYLLCHDLFINKGFSACLLFSCYSNSGLDEVISAMRKVI
jgi:GTP-binding protein